MRTAVIPEAHGQHPQDHQPNPPAAFFRPKYRSKCCLFSVNRLGQVHGFQMGHSNTPEELNFPKFGSILREFHAIADFRGAIRSVSQKNAPPLGKTVLNLKRLLKPRLATRYKASRSPYTLFLISRVQNGGRNRRLARESGSILSPGLTTCARIALEFNKQN